MRVSHLSLGAADNQLVPRLLALLTLVVAAAGCMNAVADPNQGDEPGAGRTQSFTDPGASALDPSADADDATDASDEPAQGGDDGDAQPPVVNDDDAAPPPEADPDGDGAVSVDEPALPASAGQACVEWTDCGPHFANTNSGFDCVDSTCTCDATGQWSVACAGIGGFWSPEECFCFVGTTPPPSEAAVLPQSISQGGDNAEDIVCWWRWKDLGCDADRWVDRSYYERVCDSHGCWSEYVPDGYYEDGDCRGRWIKRCSDGYEYW